MILPLKSWESKLDYLKIQNTFWIKCSNHSKVGDLESLNPITFYGWDSEEDVQDI